MSEVPSAPDQLVRDLVRETLLERAGIYVDNAGMALLEYDLTKRGIPLEEFVSMPQHRVNALARECRWGERYCYENRWDAFRDWTSIAFVRAILPATAVTVMVMVAVVLWN